MGIQITPKKLSLFFLTDTLKIRYRELKNTFQDLDYISCGKINRKILKQKIREKLPFLNSFYNIIISKNLYVHGGIPIILLTEINSIKKLNLKIFSHIINKNKSIFISKSGINSILTFDQSPDLPTENSIEIKKLLDKINLQNLVI